MKSKVSLAALLILAVVSVLLVLWVYPVKYDRKINELSEKYSLDKSMVYAVIKTESNFNPKAVSKRGAKGLMQIMDQTGEWAFLELGGNGDFNPLILLEPEVNIEIGCWYLDKLYKQFKDIDTALAAYNAGSGNVSKWLSDPEYFDGKILHTIPFKETREYVRKVNKNKRIYELLRGIKS